MLLLPMVVGSFLLATSDSHRCWLPRAQLPHYARGRLWSAPAGGGLRWYGERVLGLQQLDLGLEVGRAGERLVDAREAQVRHRIELAQRSEDRHADLVGGHLG